jgi:toxin ParE1/3/4
VRISWTTGAIRQLDRIHAFYAELAPHAAAKLYQKIQAATQRLEMFPESGRLSSDGAFREVIVPGCDFIVAYRVKDDAVEIIRVYHARRMLPLPTH